MTYTYGANSQTKHISVVSLETLDLSTGTRIPELDHPKGVAGDDGTISEGGQPGGPFEVQDDSPQYANGPDESSFTARFIGCHAVPDSP